MAGYVTSTFFATTSTLPIVGAHDQICLKRKLAANGTHLGVRGAHPRPSEDNAESQTQRLVSVGLSNCALHVGFFAFFRGDNVNLCWRDPEADRDDPNQASRHSAWRTKSSRVGWPTLTWEFIQRLLRCFDRAIVLGRKN